MPQPLNAMRILLFNLQFPPDTNSTGRLMDQLCTGLIALGHEVTVVTTFPHYENFRIWDEYRGKFFTHEQERGMEIVRLFTYAPGKKNMINRLLSYGVFNVLATLAGVFCRGRWDVILCTNGSFFTGLTGWLVGKAKKAPFIYNVQDLYPDVPIRAGQLRNPWAIATLKRIEKFMYRQATHITVISSTMRDNLVSKGVPGVKISVVPNFVDTDFIRPLPKANSFAQQFGLSDKFVVTHAGNLGYVYDLDTMLDAARCLSSQTDILFLIVGSGVAKGALEKRAQELKLSNVRFMSFQPLDSLPWLRASSDVQVSLYKNGAATESFPSKVYEIMASGRPLLAGSDGDSAVEDMVRTTGCGVCVSPGNTEQLTEAILNLYRNPSLCTTMGQLGRRYVEENHSMRVAISRYNDLFHALCG